MTNYRLRREVLPVRSALDKFKNLATMASVVFVTGVSFAVTIVVLGSWQPEPICISQPKLEAAIAEDYSMSELENMIDLHRFDVECDPLD